jgi:tetratricopeptide (TPR) repeat protein
MKSNLSGTLSLCAALISFFTALTQLAAYFPEDDWIRQGNAAVAEGELEKALSLYEKAEPHTTDPGRVAFNKATVLYRLKRYREAELHYLRCLEDRQAPPARQAQALLSLGNSLLRQAEDKNVPMLDRAIDAFSICLTQPGLDPQLATDAQYNLELARWLRFRAEPPATTPPGEEDKPQPKPKEKRPQDKDKGPDNNGSNSRDGPDNNDPGSKKSDDPKLLDTLAKKLTGHGSLYVLPDTDGQVELAPEDTARHLDDLVRRVREQRRQGVLHRPSTSRPTKDW